MGRPYFITALIVRAIQVMGKWILPLLRGVSCGKTELWMLLHQMSPNMLVATIQE
jgi:hypothetical protein